MCACLNQSLSSTYIKTIIVRTFCPILIEHYIYIWSGIIFLIYTSPFQLCSTPPHTQHTQRKYKYKIYISGSSSNLTHKPQANIVQSKEPTVICFSSRQQPTTVISFPQRHCRQQVCVNITFLIQSGVSYTIKAVWFYQVTMSTTTEPQAKKAKMSSLEQLKSFTTIVADTGDFEGIIHTSSVITINYSY